MKSEPTVTTCVVRPTGFVGMDRFCTHLCTHKLQSVRDRR
jgi:hypothetical protein